MLRAVGFRILYFSSYYVRRTSYLVRRTSVLAFWGLETHTYTHTVGSYFLGAVYSARLQGLPVPDRYHLDLVT